MSSWTMCRLPVDAARCRHVLWRAAFAQSGGTRFVVRALVASTRPLGTRTNGGAPFVIVGRVGIDAAPQQQLHRLAVAIACQLAQLARRLGLAVHQLAAVLANHRCHLLVAVRHRFRQG
eukprot:4468602-Prymnesium_polylepis.1